jgi:hypothetical protein
MRRDRVAGFGRECHTSRVAYHEAFWVALAAAAPVVALAAIVLAGDLVEIAISRLSPDRPPLSRADRFYSSRAVGSAVAGVALILVIVCTEATVFLYSLESIAYAGNGADPLLQGWVAFGCLLGILLVTMLSITARVCMSRLDRSRRPAGRAARPVRSATGRRARPRWQSRPPVRRRRG